MAGPHPLAGPDRADQNPVTGKSPLSCSGEWRYGKRFMRIPLLLVASIGVSKSTLQRLEQGEQNITVDMLEHLLSKFSAGMSEVFPED